MKKKTQTVAKIALLLMLYYWFLVFRFNNLYWETNNKIICGCMAYIQWNERVCIYAWTCTWIKPSTDIYNECLWAILRICVRFSRNSLQENAMMKLMRYISNKIYSIIHAHVYQYEAVPRIMMYDYIFFFCSIIKNI